MGSVGALLVFDVSRRMTFFNVKNWLKDLYKYGTILPDHIILVGNKNDKETYRDVEFEDAKKFADDNNIFYIETSAKTGHMINHVFEKLCQDIYTKYPDGVDKDGEHIRGIKVHALQQGGSFNVSSYNNVRNVPYCCSIM
jgi:Ras-related protein Rab-2A